MRAVITCKMCIAHIIIHMIATFVQLICLCIADSWVIAALKKWEQTNEFTHKSCVCWKHFGWDRHCWGSTNCKLLESWILDEVWNAGFWKWVKRTVHISILWNDTFQINSFKPLMPNHFYFHHPAQHAHCQCLCRKLSFFRGQHADKAPTLVTLDPPTLLRSLSLNVKMLLFRTVAMWQTSQSFKR